MQWIRTWRWYTWIAIGLWATMALTLGLSLIEPLLEAFDVLLGRARTLTERARWPLRLASGVTVLTLSWQHYVVPLLASADVTFKDRRTPRMMLRNYWLSLWMPFIVASILCVTNLSCRLSIRFQQLGILHDHFGAFGRIVIVFLTENRLDQRIIIGLVLSLD